MYTQQSQDYLEKIKADLARSQFHVQQIKGSLERVDSHEYVPNQIKEKNISFIMPAYNCADTIEESVDSIFNGNFTDGDELIIVNDGSTDNTEKVLEKLRRNYPSIKVLNHPQNRGGASARNTAVRNATHSIIFCLDSDNILVPGSVSKLKSFMLASGADVAVFKELHFFISEKQNVIHKWVYKDLITLDVFFTGDPIPGASGNYMFTKESWVKAGGYPELAVCLDTHGFGFKQLATGAKMLTCQGLYYYHRQGIESYYVRDSKKHNLSQIMAQIITPFTYLINEEDVRYIYGEGKDTWFADLEKRPIRLREGVDVANPLSALGEALENPMLDLQELCRKHLLTPKGVIHIGAHEGAEIKRYQAMGVHKVLFIEANPVVFERLSVNIASIRNVQAVNCAISNQNGMVNLRVTSMDQSSSILPLKRHQEIYPHIQETEQVTVKGRTLDTLLDEMEIQPSEYNIINLDIQGAELLALQGSTDCLKYIDAINTEVNYEELYEGCALISQLDDFLWLQGFERVATVTPFHPSWGDAFYVRKSVITMSTLGTNGRFANQIFQYAFLKIYAKEHQLKLQTSEWIGQYLFGHQEPVISRDLPQVKDPYSEIDDLAKAIKDNSITPYTNVDFWGYFQYHTSCYAPHKDYFCSLFQPVPGVKTKLQLAVQSLHAKGKTVVGLHLRRGDYGYNEFFITPNEWYKKWLQEIWGSLEQPVLFIASDEIDKVIGDFREYNPITSKDLGIELPEAPFYPDFYLLSQCHIVAISNSSFSFAACMLNEDGKLFVRPHLFQEKLIPFEPWNDHPILRESQIAQHSLAEARGANTVLSSPSLPVNFFTIVLNGEPFIRYHIEVFKQLPFKWHWHIVEGVAELKHDTAWSVSLGGKVTDEIHRNGRSNDGTTEYLDKLKQEYPDNITIYRKPEGIFWDGKREMVNAPLTNINQECLLWQVDVDELWTKEQICTTRQIFIDNPNKTAAWYWCWYFVGENLVISTRNCYAHNPNQEWLRTWRFKPGMNWQKHEPPCLGELGSDGEWHDVAAVNPFRHEETEKQGLVFQHFAYVMNKQLQFKETYYGYKDAVLQWSQLQKQTQFPVLLRDYVGWVHDETMVNTATSMGLLPILSKAADGINWRFKIGSQEVLAKDSERIAISEQSKAQIKDSIKVIVDGVFFQLNHTGIARVWNSLLEEWVISGFAKQVLVLDRAGSAPKINGVQYRTVEAYNYGATDADRQILQQICDEEGADIFISTYYTTPLSTPSVFMGYDMIPEVIGKNLDNEPMWREKHYGIKHASAYITISKNTAYNLAGCFPHISPSNITVAHCGVKTNLFPANSQKISAFRSQYGIYKPYFLLVGERSGWCGYKNGILFFKAFAQLANKHDFEIVCTGGVPTIEEEFLQYTSGVQVHKLYLTDEELRVAYSGAVVLVYPSLYEGFGMPVIEAMACGCPVIASKRASIPEVAGTAALYISGFDVSELVNALQEVQKPELRNQLISAGLEQAKKFSWFKMAEIVREALLQATNKSSSDSAIIATKEIKKAASTFNIRSGKSLPKISIVTPSFNQGEYLEECIDSVLSQGYPNLEYVIMDGGSTDGSVEIIKKYEKYLNYWQSKPDGGQYASINQGFAKTNGEIMAWINSDDKYHHDAFFKVAAAFNKYPQMEWLMGRPNAWDGLNGNAHWIAEYEPQWSREFLLGKTWKSCGQWIQQESTFWKRSLWNKAGGQLQLDPPMVTADFELWVRFSRHAQLYFMDTLLGGARWHEKQRSRVFWDRCMEEIDEVLAKEQALIASGLHQTSLPAPPPVVLSAEEIVALKQQTKQIIQVSAIVSTYNSAKFIRGCLETLVNQTLYQKGELEIVVIDSASQQNEESIVKEFQAKYPNIIYERTSERETLYASWNRAIKMARGVYITNANTDERLRSDALEIMANYLDNQPEISLVYPDQLITNTPNDTWETTKADRRWNWPPFDYSELESRCIIGSQPMWRKSLHEKYGYFRPEFTSAGDYEFWLRIGKTEKLDRIPETLGLYYENPQGLEHSSSVGQQETQKILEEYGITQRGVIPKTSIPVAISPSELNALPYRQIGQSTVNIGRPLVSVIIPTKNRPEMLPQAIQSVLNQTFTELEIIVVNDGGVDVQSVISPLNAKGNIVYKKHDRALDRSAARNTGIRAARGKYIAYLDDDDIYYPNHIETLVKFLENGEYKIAYTDAVMAQQEKQNGEYVTVHRSVPYSLDFDNDKILVSNCTPNLCLMHEKSCLDEVGLFDESLSTHEDWDLIIRLSRKFNIAHIKETTCEFTQRNDGTNTSSHNRADFTRTREVIFNQYRQYAEANPAILEAQKEAFIAEAKELAQQVQQIQSQVIQKESQLQETQAEKSQLAAQLETWQRSTQEVQAKLEATQSEKQWVKSQLNSWKQTAEEMQRELDRSRSKLKQAQSQLERSAFPLSKS
ncbi:MAG: FkbM family methyltransferase [Microcoleus sp.]